ncbi:MAG: type II toxin-antitoxin system prevent-host-death family antitoxin [Terriglobia bacterium]
MRSSLARRAKRTDAPSPALTGMERWKLEDAKARLSEVVRLAGTSGPQMVTVRGREAAVILAPEQYQRLLPKQKSDLPLARFLKGLGLAALHVEREIDAGREINL